MKRSLVHVSALSVGLWLGVSGQAHAAPLTCPDPLGSGQTRQYTVDPAINCFNQTSGSFVSLPGWMFLDKAGDNPSGVGVGDTNGWLTTVGTVIDDDDPVDTYSAGTFTVSAAAWSAYGRLALVLKDGGSPQWGIFELERPDSGGTSGTWAIGPQGALSHAELWGIDDDRPLEPIPEPATLTLLGLGLLGVARARRLMNRSR